MFHKKLIVVMASMLAAFVCLSVGPAGARSEPPAEAYNKCERECIACARACDTCHKHCLAMVKSGDKAHAVSAALSMDCIDICNITARIIARKGPMTAAMCEACIKSCNSCSEECGKSPSMAPMAECKKACDSCATRCKELLSAF